MTSRWLERYHNSRCTRKGGFRTAEFADEMAEKASRKTGELIISYKCYDCGRWHIGPRRQDSARRPQPAAWCASTVLHHLRPANPEAPAHQPLAGDRDDLLEELRHRTRTAEEATTASEPA